MSADDRFDSAAPYERYMGRWSRLVAPAFLDWFDAPAGARWIDVGCGTGALTEEILDRAAPASVLGVDPSAGFLDAVRGRLGDRATFAAGEAERLPVDDAAADVVVAGLSLNFAPDPSAALHEWRRATAEHGHVGAYVWDYAEGMGLLREFFAAARSVVPDASDHDEAARFEWCRPEPLRRLVGDAFGHAPRIDPLEVDAVFADFDDLWEPFLGGQGVAPVYLATLAPEQRDLVREALRARLAPAADGTITLDLRAWAVAVER
ncbi:class I SAM-dependent methyltransferase [Agromyces sp. MMS24-K17]|uniref:class I SAM-dependent methyltransferase n=1 Tax=Agromyces sp. MMS24-K17 TaxID=3372850 RepID=UPI00375430AB